MELEKPRIYKVSDDVFEEYRSRLATALIKGGYDADSIANDSEMKQFISNWVEQNVINDKTKNALIGITHKLAHMEIAGAQKGTFPIVHQYLWHNLQCSIIFVKDSDGHPVVQHIPVEKEIITSISPNPNASFHSSTNPPPKQQKRD